MIRTIEVVYESGVLRPLEPLPFAENQRLMVTVSEKEKEEKHGAPDIYRRKEMEWLRLHRKEYPGEYVALDGDQLVAHHKDGNELYRSQMQRG